jgi:hypothetical protein
MQATNEHEKETSMKSRILRREMRQVGCGVSYSEFCVQAATTWKLFSERAETK